MGYAHYRSFLAVARVGSFTGAAQALNLSQPTITAQVRELETAYDVELFHRRGRRIELTDIGKTLFGMAQRLFGVEEEMIDFLKAAGELRTGHLKMSAAGPFYVMRMLAEFRRIYPSVTVSVTTDNSAEALAKLLNYHADVALLANREPDPRLYCEAIGSHPLLVFVSRHHPWAGRKGVRFEELHRQPMILREVGSNTRKIFEQAAAAAGFDLNIVMEIDSRDAIREAVAEGIGIGVVGEQAFVPDERVRALRLLDIEILMHRYLACLKGRRDNRLIQTFFEVSKKSSLAAAGRSRPPRGKA